MENKEKNKSNNQKTNNNNNTKKPKDLKEAKNKDVQSFKNDEVKQLKDEIKNLNEIISNLKIENLNLKNEIQKNNQDFVQKLTTKAQEAQKLVKEKQDELEYRFEVEVKNKIANYIEKKFSSILDSINQLNLIVNSNVTSDEVKNYLMGFKMILDLFDRSLQDMNIQKIEINPGDKFNENFMSAFEIVEDSNYDSQCVVKVVNPGYKFEDKVIKYAVVKVQK